MALILHDHEEAFKVYPVGIRYKCEQCGKGEMIATQSDPMVFDSISNLSHLRKHKCTECGLELLLPKTYPYIEWLSELEYNNFINSNIVY